MGIKTFNRLPLEVRKSKGFKDFKHKLKLFLLFLYNAGVSRRGTVGKIVNLTSEFEKNK
jgi:hypothetical protein